MKYKPIVSEAPEETLVSELYCLPELLITHKIFRGRGGGKKKKKRKSRQ